MKTLIKNALLINEYQRCIAHILIEDEFIKAIIPSAVTVPEADIIIDATGLLLLPGGIDDQVHFRDPGLTHKGDIFSESRAAAAGGITSFMDMPNTIPQTTTIAELNRKFETASQKSLVNYSFYLGATNHNIDEIEKIDIKHVCGVKMFMGSSTGNMLVNNDESVSAVFEHSPVLVAVHCENDDVIADTMRHFTAKYGDNIPISCHAEIRNTEACYSSSAKAVELASKHNARLHILHLSTEKEIALLSNKTLEDKRVTGEVCVHHLWFNSNDYHRLDWRIKWNPSIKSEADRLALIEALKSGYIDIVATDHAPHTFEEKQNKYSNCPSGAPMIQHSLTAMLEMVSEGIFTYEEVVSYMCHKPARLFQISKRGFIRENYYADLVLVDPNENWQVEKSNILYKCGWAPMEGQSFSHKIITCFVNGTIVYNNGVINDSKAGLPLIFER